MVESIYFLKPAWCGNHLAGLRPEIGLTARYCSHRLPGGGLSLGAGTENTVCRPQVDSCFRFAHPPRRRQRPPGLTPRMPANHWIMPAILAFLLTCPGLAVALH